MAGVDVQVTEIYIWVLCTVACQVVNVFGVVTNIINIMCFIKQGFKDAVNISLLGKTYHINKICVL